MADNERTKVWTATATSPAGFQVTERQVYMVGDKNNFVVADPGGIAMVGKSINFGVTSENIRYGAFFTSLNDFVQMIPTTLVTPMPNQMPSPPLALASGFIKDSPYFLGLLA